jgi:hypothetical protein
MEYPSICKNPKCYNVVVADDHVDCFWIAVRSMEELKPLRVLCTPCATRRYVELANDTLPTDKHTFLDNQRRVLILFRNT